MRNASICGFIVSLVVTVGFQAEGQSKRVRPYVGMRGMLNLGTLQLYRQISPSEAVRRFFPYLHVEPIMKKLNAENIHHVALAVPSIENILKDPQNQGLFQDRQGTVESQKVKVAMLDWLHRTPKEADLFMFELLESIGNENVKNRVESDPDKISEHHVAFEVQDINKELGNLDALGVPLINKQSRPGFDGMVGFLSPKAGESEVFKGLKWNNAPEGVKVPFPLIELVQPD